MGNTSRELQRCNAATASAEPNLFELCRAPAASTKSTLQQRVQSQTCLSYAECQQPRRSQRCNSECRAKINLRKHKNSCGIIREPQWAFRTFAIEIESDAREPQDRSGSDPTPIQLRLN